MGRARGRKLTVEECACLSTVELHRSGVFLAGFGTDFNCRWQRANSLSDNTAGCKVVEMPGIAMGLLMSYEVSHGRLLSKRSMEYVIGVITSRCHYGGRRYWLRCPVLRNGIPCGRRALKLYLVPGSTIFTCRQCSGLTHRSCQEADKRVYALARSPELLHIALRMGTIRQQLLAASAVTLLIRRMNRKKFSGKQA